MKCCRNIISDDNKHGGTQKGAQGSCQNTPLTDIRSLILTTILENEALSQFCRQRLRPQGLTGPTFELKSTRDILSFLSMIMILKMGWLPTCSYLECDCCNQ